MPYNIFLNSNGSNGSKEYEQSAPSETSGTDTDARSPPPPIDHYHDLHEVLLQQSNGKLEFHAVIIPTHRDLNVLRPENPTIGDMEDLEPRLVCFLSAFNDIIDSSVCFLVLNIWYIFYCHNFIFYSYNMQRTTVIRTYL